MRALILVGALLVALGIHLTWLAPWPLGALPALELVAVAGVVIAVFWPWICGPDVDTEGVKS